MSTSVATSDPATAAVTAPRHGRAAAATAAAVAIRRALRRVAARPYAPLGPLLLYALVAVGMLYPFWPTLFRADAGDLHTVIGAIVEAGNALAEGQFPIRVAPRQHDGARDAFFQFYGNFPFTLAAAIDAALPGPGPDPYLAWKVTTGLMLTVGGFYTWRLCRRLTRRNPSAVVAGVVFMTAPYMFADVLGRGAFTEFVAFNLLPVAFYYAWRTFAAPGAGRVCASAVAWALLGLSHNITYLYGVTFIGLWFLSLTGFRRRAGGRLGRVVGAGLLHGVLVLWYLVPQVTLIRSIMMGAHAHDPFPYNELTTLGALLSPVAHTVRQTPWDPPHLTTQVGLPVLALVMLAILSLARPGLGRLRRRLTTRGIMFFGVAFVLAWSPVDVWRYLPKEYSFVQFPYRLLMFVVLFGSVAGACALAWLLRMRRWQVPVGLLLVGLAVSSYVPRTGPYQPDVVEAQVRDPRIGGAEDYHLTPAAAARTSFCPPGVNFVGRQFGLAPGGGWLRSNAAVTLPTPQTAEALELSGSLPADASGAAKLVVLLDGRRHDLPLNGGAFSFRIPAPATGGKPCRLDLSPQKADGSPGAVRLERVAFVESAEPATTARAAIPADAVRRATHLGRWTYATVTVDRPAIVTFPVFYFPGLMRVVLDGASVEPRNVGRYLALELPPGSHEVATTFTGAAWANWLSLGGWVGVLAAPGLLARRKRRVDRGGARFTAGDALLGAAALAAGVVAVVAFPYLTGTGPMRTSVVANVPSVSGNPPENAFDGDATTVWAVPPGPSPVLAIRPRQGAAKLRDVTLDSRETGLFESWQTVRVVLYLDGATVLDRTVKFADADRVGSHKIDLGGRHRTDRVELHFADPVLRTKDGGTVTADVVNPGYREIRLGWSESE
jgi:hypothetical protein